MRDTPDQLTEPDSSTLQRFLSQVGYRVIQIETPRPAVDILAVVKSLGEINDSGSNYWHDLAHLLQLCRQEQVAIWHAHDPLGYAFGALLARFWPMRLVATVDETALAKKKSLQVLLHYHRILIESTRALHAVTELGVASNNCVRIDPAIHLSHYPFEPYERPGESAQRHGPVILKVGCLSDDTAHLDTVSDRLHERGLMVKAEYLDDSADLIQSIRELDVVIITRASRIGIAIMLHAMALGKPVIASRLELDFLRDGRTALIIDDPPIESLTRTLFGLVNNPNLGDTLSRAARRVVESRHTWTIALQRLTRVYDELLSHSTRGSRDPSGGQG